MATPQHVGTAGMMRPLKILLVFMLASSLLLYVFFQSLPNLSQEHRRHIRIPLSVEEMKALGTVLAVYTNDHYLTVLVGYCLTFIILQTFSIPGTIFLVVVGGAIFGFAVGFSLAIFNSTVGASAAYWLSYFVSHSLVYKYFPSKLSYLQEKIDQNRRNLFWYMLFLRVTPLVPNWFINIASPLLNVPFWVFATATCFGIMPAMGMFVQTGLALHEISSTEDLAHSASRIVVLLGLGMLSLLPTYEPVQKMLQALLVSRKHED